MFHLYQLTRLIELAWVANADLTTEDVMELIREADKGGHEVAASVLREHLAKLTRGEFTKIVIPR